MPEEARRGIGRWISVNSLKGLHFDTSPSIFTPMDKALLSCKTFYRRMLLIVSGCLLSLLAFNGCSFGATSEQTRLDPRHLSLAISGAYEEAEKDPWWLAAEARSDSLLKIKGKHVDLDWLQGFGERILKRGSPNRKWVALTFDDGPHPNTTPRLLSILKAYHAKATFFLVGMMAEAYPDLVLEEQRAGHLIANHSYHHVNLTKIQDKDIGTELEACSLVLQHITGEKPRFFRPPGGDYNPTVLKIAENLGFRMVLWTDDPGDYSNPGKQLVLSRLLNRLSRGGIIVLHDGPVQTQEILPQILSSLENDGYTLVTLEDFCR